MFLQEPKTQLSTFRLALVMGVGTGAGSHWCTSSNRGDTTAEQSSKEGGENVEFAEDLFVITWEFLPQSYVKPISVFP